MEVYPGQSSEVSFFLLSRLYAAHVVLYSEFVDIDVHRMFLRLVFFLYMSSFLVFFALG